MKYDTSGIPYDLGGLPYDGNQRTTLVVTETHDLGYGKNKKRPPYLKREGEIRRIVDGPIGR